MGMAHLHSNHANIFKGSQIELHFTRNLKNPFHKVHITNQIKRGVVHCCTSERLEANAIYQDKNTNFGLLFSDANWQIRRMVETKEEMKNVAGVQAEAFHEPVFLFDDLFFDFFKAEVLQGLLYRLRNSAPDRYACLVAESTSELLKEVVGVVDVTVLREDSVLEHLPGVDEYLYVSGIAVLNKFRRQKVATTLLQACDILASIWGFKYLALRAYEDDYGAQNLYSRAGYRVVSADPKWTTTWIGRRRRILMIKMVQPLVT